MSKKETDISLIRKYLNGELDARAMHQLEARAQDDPFLMDALEGYEKAKADPQPALADLNKRLQQRVARKQRRIIPLRTLAIAASVLVVLTIGWLWLNKSKPGKLQLATAVKPVDGAAVKPAAQDTAQIAQAGPSAASKPLKQQLVTVRKAEHRPPATAETTIENKQANAKAIFTSPQDNAADTTPLNEMVVMNYAAGDKKPRTDTITAADKAFAKVKPAPTIDNVLKSSADGVTKTPSQSPFSSPQHSPIILQGRVIDKNDGMPLPGATVKVKGGNYGAITDVNGKFKLPVDSDKSKLEIAYLGYNTAKVDAGNQDSVKTFGLEPSSKSLSEVVVTRVDSKKKGNKDNGPAAHPKEGWTAFYRYLKENAISADGKTGVVKLSFLVSANGEISNVLVVKGLSEAANQKAIDLLTSGPGWSGNSFGKAEQVKLQISFTTLKK